MTMVVALQEKNAPIPATLPKHTSLCVDSCKQLVSVAKDLADAEYEDFPGMLAVSLCSEALAADGGSVL
jgi:hypothetical protein